MDVKRVGTLKKEYNKLARLFKNIDKDKRELIEGLILTAAFAYSEMDSCMLKIQMDGVVVDFKNGKQQFKQKHPAFDVYTKLHSQYLATLRELAKYQEIDGVTMLNATKNTETPIDKMVINIRDRKLGMG